MLRSCPALPVFPSLLICATAFYALLPGQTLAAQTHRPPAHKLVVICVAGLDERFLSEPPTRLKIPNIRKLMREGSAASGVVGVAPSETRDSQVSIMTGVPPSEENSSTLTLWQEAARDRLRVASVYWPGTGGAEILYDFPAVRERGKGQNISFDEVAQKSTPAGLADRIEKISPGFEKELWDDSSAVRAAVFLLQEERPDLLLVGLSDVDSEQRETGAQSTYARDMLENDDELIGQVLAALPRGTIVALVSGHGFENENFIVRPRVLLKESGKPESAVEVQDGLIGTADRNVADRLRKLLADGHRHGLAREIPMAQVKAKAPGLARWVGAFDTQQNYVASAEESGPALGPGTHLGVSGLWPTRPGYRSVLIIAGEGVLSRKLGEVDLLQIAPTLADILGVAMPQAQAKSLWRTISR
ncbi:MAG: alkaline phosphatase family protein [Acidobacteriota bacterium]|nr:alkaline phosphatase family protein [Acidobacteriota bacterium]